MRCNRNRKGSAPVLVRARWSPHAILLRYGERDRWEWQKPVERATDVLEAMWVILRTEKMAVTFARAVAFAPRQLSLWGGV